MNAPLIRIIDCMAILGAICLYELGLIAVVAMNARTHPVILGALLVYGIWSGARWAYTSRP